MECILLDPLTRDVVVISGPKMYQKNTLFQSEHKIPYWYFPDIFGVFWGVEKWLLKNPRHIWEYWELAFARSQYCPPPWFCISQGLALDCQGALGEILSVSSVGFQKLLY